VVLVMVVAVVAVWVIVQCKGVHINVSAKGSHSMSLTWNDTPLCFEHRELAVSGCHAIVSAQSNL